MPTNYVSQIQVPDGSIYVIKDSCAWAEIASLYSIINQGSFAIRKVDSLNELPTASANTLNAIYLVPCNSHDPSIIATGVNDIFDEYVTVVGGTEQSPVYTWEKIGNTDVNLDNYALASHTHNVTGIAVSAGAHRHSISPTKRYLQAQSNVPLSFGTGNFVTNLSTSNLVTASINAVQAQPLPYIVSSASEGITVQVAKPGTAKTYSEIISNPAGAVTVTCTSANTATGELGTATDTQGPNTPMWDAVVSNETLSFKFKPLETATRVTNATATTTATVTSYNNSSITGINGFVNYTPYTFTNVSIPRIDVSAITVATGSVSSTGRGATVATGGSTGTAYNAINSSVSLLKNASPTTSTISNVQIVTDVAETESEGAHTHTLDATTGQAI